MRIKPGDHVEVTEEAIKDGLTPEKRGDRGFVISTSGPFIEVSSDRYETTYDYPVQWWRKIC